jgi:imidazolonepropionase-like amidohydrolase
MSAETIIHNAKIATNAVPSFVEALAIKDGKISAVGTDDEIMRQRAPATKVIDGKGRTVIPGLHYSWGGGSIAGARARSRDHPRAYLHLPPLYRRRGARVAMDQPR